MMSSLLQHDRQWADKRNCTRHLTPSPTHQRRGPLCYFKPLEPPHFITNTNAWPEITHIFLHTPKQLPVWAYQAVTPSVQSTEWLCVLYDCGYDSMSVSRCVCGHKCELSVHYECLCSQYCGVYSRLWMRKYKECVCVSQLCHYFPVKYRAVLEIITPLYPGFDRTSSISVTMSSYDIMFLFSVFNIGASKNWQAS